MKCENCGKYEANYHYKSNINGKITEKHLCGECAAKLGAQDQVFGMDDMFEGFDSMFSDMFGGFFGRPAKRISPFGSFGFAMPTFVLPRFEIKAAEEPESATAVKEAPETGEKSGEDPEMKKRREVNMLRHQMKMAAKNEEYEKAAELRDKLRKLDNAE